jgi:hypothetical protein
VTAVAGAVQARHAGPNFLAVPPDHLAQVRQEHGRETMLRTAKNQPSVFFAACARLIGPEVKLTIQQSLPGNLSMEDWQVVKEIIAAVRQAIPDASSKPPGAVLEHVLDALRQADARVLNCPIYLIYEQFCLLRLNP